MINHRLIYQNKGFTLVEIMIAIFLLSIGAMIIAAVYPTAQISRTKAVHTTYAMSLAQQKVEELKSAGYASVLVGSPIVSAINEIPNGQQTITVTQYSTYIKKVDISITWDGFRMVGGSVSLVTFISDHG